MGNDSDILHASPPSRAVWTLEGAGFKALTQADL